MSVKSILVWRIIPSIALAVAAAIGWFASHDRPMGVFFATLIPLMKGILPPTIVGHGKMKGTPHLCPMILCRSLVRKVNSSWSYRVDTNFRRMDWECAVAQRHMM